MALSLVDKTNFWETVSSTQQYLSNMVVNKMIYLAMRESQTPLPHKPTLDVCRLAFDTTVVILAWRRLSRKNPGSLLDSLSLGECKREGGLGMQISLGP